MVEIITDFNKLETLSLPANIELIFGILKHDLRLITQQEADVYNDQYNQ